MPGGTLIVVKPLLSSEVRLPTEPTNPREHGAGSLRPRVLPLVPGVTRPPGGPRRPLPDAGAVRRLVIPDSAPPYDDELAALAPAAVPGPAVPRPWPGPDRRAQPRPGQPPGTDQAAAQGWPGRFAQVLAETLAGSRPPRQIVPWTTDQARRHIRQLGPLLSAGERPLVRRVVASRPAAGVIEMTVIVAFGPRLRALAIRLELDGPRLERPGRPARPQRWRCTAVEAA